MNSMKIMRQNKMIFLAIIVLSFTISKNKCYSMGPEDVAMFDKQVIQLEETWKAGKTNEYFLKARDIAKDIKAHSATNNLNKVATKLFENLISKEVKIEELNMEALRDLWMGDLPVMDDLAWHLISDDKVSVEERRSNTLLLCRYLGKIRKELIPNFQPKRVMSNVAPPRDARSGFMFSGMNPAAITNPVVRAQYEAARRENRANNLINIRQQKLKSIESGALKTRIIGYIIETFDAGDISSPLFTECINSASLNDKEKEEVLKKVGSKQPKQESARGTNQNAR